MKFNGKIKNLNHIVISDPSYKKDVWCRYEKDNLDEENWFVDFNISPTETKVGNYYIKGNEISLLLKKDKDDCEFDGNGTLNYLRDIELKDYKIGMDTACVALGINDNATEIINSIDEWQPSCAIRTGGDGIFGEVAEGTRNGKLCFLFITGYLEEEFGKQNEIFDYLIKQFEIAELQKEDITLFGDVRRLNNGDIVEVSSCAITNDLGGTTIIRNSNFKNEINGMNITIENSDGTIEHTTLESHDKLTELPIEIEVIDSFFDYETGYNYKGRITNDDLIKEFREYGTTGLKPDDYKKYENKSLYEDVLKSSKNYDPSTVHFSEFDVIKLLEKNSDKEMEI